MSYKVPNWAQMCLAKAAGLDPEKVAVEHDGDSTVTFLQYLPRKRILVSKADGSIITQQDKYAECRRDGVMVGQLIMPQQESENGNQ